MSIKLRLLRSVRNVNYVFKLNPVEVKKIDILESKLKDQQDELDRLRGKIGEINPTFLYVESTTWVSSKLKWENVTSEKFALTANNTSIRVLAPGLYNIGVLVNHMPVQNHVMGTISLQKNGAQIQCAVTSATYDNYNGRYQSHQTSSSLMCIVQIKENEEITVVCTGSSAIANASSYLTALWIGD
ncbi:hypothetical protein PHMEG_00011768 [Phytophthora megakarya]|uniref:C1q domain-containing protein n=1 Tax=Phytophthora megakarya TaxID=4795 RepID=A0A225WAG1_9STRA|nr:hypothetical protein PHMEG_00011768 [Phytophthora megakarya]